MSWFTVAWLVWGAIFVIVEGIALFNKKDGDTLSEHVRKWAATSKKDRGNSSAWCKLRRLALLAFMVWLSVHFLVEGMV